MANNAPSASTDPRAQGEAYIATIHQKMSDLVAEFAAGKINRAQFHHVYDRYQRQIMTVEQLITESDPTAWQDAVIESENTFDLRHRLMARALGMSIYDNANDERIETLGEFEADNALIASILRSYRSAAAETFRAGLRSKQMENGRWLCFAPGEFTTLVALFSLEPAEQQLRTISRMHQDFESANQAALANRHADPERLAYPFLAFLENARRSTSPDASEEIAG